MAQHRMIFALLLFGLLDPGTSAAQSTQNCTGLRTQFDINRCALEAWSTVDAELNRLWKQIKPLADRRGTGKSLLSQQRAWLSYRDATCAGERDDFEGGSIAGYIYGVCMERLTLARNSELRALR